LLALPEEAEMLTLAQDLGTLTLLLRHPDDLDSQEKRSVVDQRTLFAGDRANELQQKRYRTIQIIRATGPSPCGERSLMAGALVFLLSGGSAFFLSLLALDGVRRAFEQYKRRYLARSVNDLSGMFLFLDPTRSCGSICARCCCLPPPGTGQAACSSRRWRPWPLLFSFAAGVVLPAPALLRFNAQLADGLQQMANALRAGFTLQQAIDQAGREGNIPLRQELGLLIKEVKLGLPLDDAMAAMAKRVGSEELDLMATSTANRAPAGRKPGGALREHRGHHSRALPAGGQDCCSHQPRKTAGADRRRPAALRGLFLDAYRPDLIAPMFETAYGYVLVGAIVLLQGTGFVLIRRIVTIDV